MHLEIECIDRRQPFGILGVEAGQVEDDLVVRQLLALGGLTDRRIADHHARHVLGGDLADLAAAYVLAAPQHRHGIGERRHLAELVGDDDDRDVLGPRHLLQEAQDLVGLARRQHRGRLVQDHEALIEIEQLQDLQLLLLAGRQ